MLRQELINSLVEEANVLVDNEITELSALKKHGELIILTNLGTNTVFVSHTSASCTPDNANYRLESGMTKIIEMDPSHFDWFALSENDENQLNFVILNRQY